MVNVIFLCLECRHTLIYIDKFFCHMTLMHKCNIYINVNIQNYALKNPAKQTICGIVHIMRTSAQLSMKV